MSSGRKQDNPDKYQPITDRAKAAVMEFGIHPKNPQDKRIFSHIGASAAYPMAAVGPIYDYIENLLSAQITEDEDTEELIFTPPKEKKNSFTERIIDDLLLLSPAVNGRRVELAYDMVKNMNRPSNNFMAGLMGLGDRNEEVITEEVPENE